MVMCELTVIGEWTIGDITSAAASIVASRSTEDTESLISPKEGEDEAKFSG
jgi:hypothetical protein